jgi:hypothetical protein
MDHSQLNTSMAPRENERKASLRPSLTSVAQTTDLANLCIEEREPDQRIVATSHPRERCQELENSLYPTVKELAESTDPHDLSVEDIFAEAERYRMSRIKESRMLQKESHFQSTQSQNSSRPGPGAYPSTSPVQMEKPELPAWVETAQHVREKVERQGFLSEVHQEASRRDPMLSPLPPSLGQANETSYREEESSNGSRSTISSSRNSNANNTYRRARPSQPQPVEVEVAPGEFMPLRGSDETLQAIEMGYARIVTCFACSASLACVPDCELVICPDCRVISPICAEQEDDRKMAHHNDSPFGCWEGNNDYYQQALSPPPRGVGLGLKMR